MFRRAGSIAAEAVVRRLTRRRIRDYSAIILVIVAVEYAVLFAAGEGLKDGAGQVKGTDFMEFYAAAQLVSAGRGSELYRFEPPLVFPSQNEVQFKILAPQTVDAGIPFIVAPYYALPFIPLSKLPYLPAYFAWFAATAVLILLVLAIVGRHLRIVREHRHLVLLVCVSFFPYMECLFDGQNSIVTLVILASVYAALKGRREGIAGALLALALYKPQLVFTIAILLLVSRRWRALVVFAVVGSLLGGISWLIVGTSGLWDYLVLARAMPDAMFIPGWKSWNMHSWHSLFGLLLGNTIWTRLLTVLATAVTLGLAIVAWRRVDPSDSDAFDLQYSVAVLATALASPHLFGYDLTLLILPALLLVNLIVYSPEILPANLRSSLEILLAAMYLAGLGSRFSAMLFGFQISVLVLAGLFSVSWLALRAVQRDGASRRFAEQMVGG